MPRGNNNYGRDYAQTYETARRHDGGAPGNVDGSARTLTGSGPVSWYHNNTPAGIADLNGNVWEWVRGMRIVDGEIQIIPENNAADPAADHSATSTLWRAILQNGSLVNPGTADTLKWNASGVNGAGNPVLATAVSSQSDGEIVANQIYKSVAAAAGVTVPNLLKVLGLHPHASDIERGYLYMRNVGERLPSRGGNWSNGVNAGVFALNLGNVRSNALTNVGFRPAFVL